MVINELRECGEQHQSASTLHYDLLLLDFVATSMLRWRMEANFRKQLTIIIGIFIQNPLIKCKTQCKSAFALSLAGAARVTIIFIHRIEDATNKA